MDLRNGVFLANVGAHFLLLLGVLWCIAFPKRRIYPMEKRTPWLYVIWGLFYFVFGSNLTLVVVDWNSGSWTSWNRLFLGVPFALLGASLLAWGISTLGTTNTSGVKQRFVKAGPYAFTRNPQYVADILLFLGFSICANSELALITHTLTALVFLIAPVAEEPWLQTEFGEDYSSYKRDVPRFL